MGRNVKRVPLDFDHPIKETWPGYLMPESLQPPQCDACGGIGSTASRQWVEQITMLLLLLDGDVRHQERGLPMHPYFHDTGSRARAGRPGPDIVEFGTGLAGRSAGSWGHDAIDSWRATEAVIKAAGLDPNVWGMCPACGGEGSIEAPEGQRAEAEAWERSEPPTGDGWQMWEDTSEGSPVSPVFATSKALADWCAPNVSVFGNIFADADRWLRIIEGDDFAHVVIAPGVIAM